MSIIKCHTRYWVSIYRHDSDNCEIALAQFGRCETLDEVQELLSEVSPGSGYLATIECVIRGRDGE